MRAEPHIPLFLWVATALVAHALGGGGATKVAEQLEETMDIGEFASQVRAKAKFAGPVEVSFEEALPDEEESEESADENSDAPLDDSEEFDPAEEDPDREESEAKTDEDVEVDEEKEEPEEEKSEEEPQEKKAEEKEETKEKEKTPDLFLAKKPKMKVMPNRRVAVEQHVEDKNQEDNPDAEFAGEHANRVAEQTQARITSTDQNAKDPTAGSSPGAYEEPGNSDESKVAQSDENDAPDDARLEVAREPAHSGSVAQRAVPAVQPGQRVPVPDTPAAQNAQAAREAKAASEAREGMVETHHHAHGAWGIAKAEEARKAQEAQMARKARARILAQKRNKKKQPLFGIGSSATTERGVRLNLSHDMAHAVIGRDQLDNLKDQVGKRRLSKHRGSWKTVGLQKWKGALENYVANVKPGNQTALNTARVPFARYLNQIHQRLHQVFAHGFLGHLEQLPANHPLNRQDMSTHVEIALSREDGRVVRMGITKSSGVTAFDVGALESVSKAAPYGPPPGSIVSSDGNVYLHWEFHRNRMYACSTYFARPYIIDVEQKQAPPRVDPPRKPNEQEKKKPDERSGSLEPNNTRERSGRSG